MKIRASHILVPTMKECTEIKSQIQLGGADFATMAKQHSKCPSGQKGGDLGYFEEGQMVSAFDAAARALVVGQLSDVVPTQFGHHLILRTA